MKIVLQASIAILWSSGSLETVKSNAFAVQVFGLGNKTYEHYNLIGQYVDKRLAELGGERVYVLGLGDDDIKLVFKFTCYLSLLHVDMLCGCE